MKKPLSSAFVLISCCITSISLAANMAIVKNGDNDGVGSFRAALDSGATSVRFSNTVSAVTITQPLIYSGEKKLKIHGSGQIIDASGLVGQADILSVLKGADLVIRDLSFVGGFYEVNTDPSTPKGGKGIFINVPEVRQGLVNIELSGVTVTGVGNHGVHVSDCALRDECGGGSGGLGQGSPASVSLKLNNVTINNVGFGKQDADGIRVDERGDGDIYFSAKNSRFIKVGADGIELDEGNSGDVVADVQNSVFDANGEYCNLVPFVSGGQCDDDGEADVDDGFDIDEAGPGSIFVGVRDSTVSNNFDEGFDFDEQDSGDISIRVSDLLALDNTDEGIKASENDDGNLLVVFKGVVSVNNNGRKEGAELEESGSGDVTVQVVTSSFIAGSEEKLKVEQDDQGQGTIRVTRSGGLVLDLDGVSEP